MSTGRRARALTGAGVVAILFGALMLVAPIAGAHVDPTAETHDAQINQNQVPADFEAFQNDEECDELPAEVTDQLGDFVWHFVTRGQETFQTLDAEFETAGSKTEFVSHPDAKHAYVSTATADRLLDATAQVETDAAPRDEHIFQLSHTCDLSVNSLTIVKAVDEDAPDEWEFEFSGNVAAEPFFLDESDSDELFDELADGSYNVTEAQHGEASLTDIDCELTGGGDTDFTVEGRTVTVDLAGGEDVTCTFSNDFPEQQQQEEELNSLTIVKSVDEDAPESWEFDFSGNVTAESFSLSDDDADRTFAELSDGSYNVTEAQHDEAELADIDCELTGGGETEFTRDGRTVTVDLAGGEDVTCTFSNDFPGVTEQTLPEEDEIVPPVTEAEGATFQVVKEVTGDVPDEWSFDFTGDLGAFTVDETSPSETHSDVEPGEVTVTESAHAEAELVAIDCEGTDTEEVDLDARSVTVDVESGDEISCTFTNDFPTVLGEQEERETTTTTESTTTTTEAEVQEQEQTTTAPPTTAEVRGDVQERAALPRTGSSNRMMSFAGVGLLVLGAAMVAGSRRRLAEIS